MSSHLCSLDSFHTFESDKTNDHAGKNLLLLQIRSCFSVNCHMVQDYHDVSNILILIYICIKIKISTNLKTTNFATPVKKSFHKNQRSKYILLE